MNKIVWILTCCLFGSALCLERDLTINVDPGKSDCFYEKAVKGQTIEVEFQVIDGTSGTLDIGLLLTGPDGKILVSLNKRQAGLASAEAFMTGDYRFCFDNTHSTISSKTVYFNLLIEVNDGESDEEESPENVEPDTIHDDLMEVATRVGAQLSKARRLQEASAARFSRDDHAAARSLSRVTLYSLTNAGAVLTIGILQVIIVRSFFDEKSKVRTLWNKLPTSLK